MLRAVSPNTLLSMRWVSRSLVWRLSWLLTSSVVQVTQIIVSWLCNGKGCILTVVCNSGYRLLSSHCPDWTGTYNRRSKDCQWKYRSAAQFRFHGRVAWYVYSLSTLASQYYATKARWRLWCFHAASKSQSHDSSTFREYERAWSGSSRRRKIRIFTP